MRVSPAPNRTVGGRTAHEVGPGALRRGVASTLVPPSASRHRPPRTVSSQRATERD